MKKQIISLAILTLLFSACQKDQDPFHISKKQVGLLTDTTQVKNLKTVFPNDSVVERLHDNEFSLNRTDIDIFDKAGNKLLTLAPKVLKDSLITKFQINVSVM